LTRLWLRWAAAVPLSVRPPYLKEQNKNIFCAAVEPEHAAILKKGYVNNPKHIIQGTGYSLIPPALESEPAG